MSDVKSMYLEADKLKDDGELDAAIAKLNEVLAIDQNHVLSHLALAVLYGRVNQHEKACEHGERACEIEPGEAFNYTALSVTYVRALAGTQDEAYKMKAEIARDRANMMQSGGAH